MEDKAVSLAQFEDKDPDSLPHRAIPGWILKAIGEEPNKRSELEDKNCEDGEHCEEDVENLKQPDDKGSEEHYEEDFENLNQIRELPAEVSDEEADELKQGTK